MRREFMSALLKLRYSRLRVLHTRVQKRKTGAQQYKNICLFLLLAWGDESRIHTSTTWRFWFEFTTLCGMWSCGAWLLHVDNAAFHSFHRIQTVLAQPHHCSSLLGPHSPGTTPFSWNANRIESVLVYVTIRWSSSVFLNRRRFWSCGAALGLWRWFGGIHSKRDGKGRGR